jgi:hypothetical protein
MKPRQQTHVMANEAKPSSRALAEGAHFAWMASPSTALRVPLAGYLNRIEASG